MGKEQKERERQMKRKPKGEVDIMLDNHEKKIKQLEQQIEELKK